MAAARKLAATAELARRNPAPPDAEFTADQVAYALGESRGRAGDLVDLAQTLRTRLPGTNAALDGGTISRYKAEIIARATALLDDAGARAAEQEVLDRAGRLTPRRAARRHRPRGDGGRAGEGEGPAGGRGEGRAGGAVGRGLRQRRADGLRAAPGRGAGRRPADHRLGQGTAQGRAGRRHGRAPRPGVPGPAAGPGLPSPPGRGRAGHPDRPAGHRDRPRGPAWRDPRNRPRRPVAGPGPGRRGRA
ncbi:MAG: DUF222 domain-containing protein [Streptosporangiaceae bacterium]